MMPPVKTVVVAQYQENLAWIPENSDVRFAVVTKDEHCPNVGREPFSFLWYIVSNYNSLQGEYFFVQGNPFDHCPALFEEVSQPVTKFRWLGRGGERYVSDAYGNPHHSGLPVEDVCCRLTNKCGITSYQFTPGGQFAITAEEIKSKPLHFYLLALAIMSENFNSHPWCFERLWETIFS